MRISKSLKIDIMKNQREKKCVTNQQIFSLKLNIYIIKHTLPISCDNNYIKKWKMKKKTLTLNTLIKLTFP